MRHRSHPTFPLAALAGARTAADLAVDFAPEGGAPILDALLDDTRRPSLSSPLGRRRDLLASESA